VLALTFEAWPAGWRATGRDLPRRTGLGRVMTTRSLSQTVGPICELAVAATLAIAISIIVLVVLCHDVVRP
jgi:hypothetical protein